MIIDVTTLYVLVALIGCVVGSILLWAGLFSDGGLLARNGGAGLFLIAIGVSLVLLRGRIPDWMSMAVAIALLTLGLGCLWSVASLFTRGKASALVVCAGPAVWLFTALVLGLHGNASVRLFVVSLVAAAYAASAGWLLWHGREDGGPARLALSLLLAAHAVFVTGRGILALLLPPMTSPFGGTALQNIVMLESPVVLFAGCFLAVGMFREHAERELRRNAETDGLTGLLNRRAFLGRAGERAKEAWRVKRPIVLLLFDLDHFKTINDRFGHAAGDRILGLFAATAGQTIRVTDVFGRIGGEEFAALLPGCDAETGRQIAERIRSDFARRTMIELGGDATATVSVGIASNGGDATDIESLMLKADAALYGSKRGGRDRVTDAGATTDRFSAIGLLSGHPRALTSP
jgi:diguanylate cyclase (GGDEF)-like protein